MNKPDPYDRPEEPECDCCEGTGRCSSQKKGDGERLVWCVLCNGTGTLSEAAQREIAEETRAERKDWRNA